MIRISWALLALTAILHLDLASAANYQGLWGVPYCATLLSRCCPNREDECSAPILGTLCYCDEFCEKSDDCCPDYLAVCKGQPPPETLFGSDCQFEGQRIAVSRSVKKNCNTCTCERNYDNTTVMRCDQTPCLISEDIINTVNQEFEMYGWHATNHTKFWARTLDEGINRRLGTLQPHRFVRRMNPVRRIYDLNALPNHFDAETKWPGNISPVQDQGWCGSSWAVSTAATASDRFAVISKGLERVTLSAQNLLSCNNRGQQSCNGGYLDKAWLFLRKYGLVDENCYPYTGHSENCRIPRMGNLLTARCAPPYDVDRKERYKVGPAYRLGNETDVMYEIMESGPVQATLKVYQDFFHYQGGIYRHTDLALQHRTGYHSVRIVGWGQEQDYLGRVNKYWKVANSWGKDWGENGYFRIARGKDECEIESFVLAAWPLTVDPINKNDVFGS